MDPDGHGFACVIRETFDWLYDGPRTGRFRWEQLRKTEKTHMGTLIEIALQREFDEFLDGNKLDYRIGGVEVDCKFSQRLGGWEIPANIRRDRGICLLIWADDRAGRFEVGLIRARNDDDAWFYMGPGNQDRKRRLSRAAESTARWLYPGGVLPPNQLLQLSDSARDRVLGARNGGGRITGQARVNELFRTIQGEVVRRNTVLTVANQKDGMKRARQAREHEQLGQEGISILCGDWARHRAVADALGLPVPRTGEFISVRLTPSTDESTKRAFALDGVRWEQAEAGAPVVPAPAIPRN